MITPSCRQAQIEPPPDGLSRVSLDNINVTGFLFQPVKFLIQIIFFHLT